MRKGEIICRTQDAHAAPRVKYDQIIVAADNNLSARGERAFEIHVVLWIAAVGDTYRWFEPDGLAAKNRQYKVMALARNGARESRAAKHLHDLGVNGRGKRDHIHLFGAQQCSFGDTVRLERSTHHNRGVEDNQSTVRRSRRSALYAANSASISASVNPAALAAAFSSAIAWASGLGPDRGRRTRLTNRPTASRFRASASVAAASGSTGMVTQRCCPYEAPRATIVRHGHPIPRPGKHS